MTIVPAGQPMVESSVESSVAPAGNPHAEAFAGCRVLVTGGAGFVGRTLVKWLARAHAGVTVLDNLSTAEPDWSDGFAEHLVTTPPRLGQVRFMLGDLKDEHVCLAALQNQDAVVHLAAHTDIPGGAASPTSDLEDGLIATWTLLEAMRRRGVREILFASSGVVYGRPRAVPTAESYGPLRPESHYAAAKLAGEAFLSGFAHLYGWRALAFRFGNTVGPASNHGVVHDLVIKLMRDPSLLEVLGDGEQAKPYVHVEDLVNGMFLAAERAPAEPFQVFNIGTRGTLTVGRVAELVIEALGIPRGSVEVRFTGPTGPSRGGWPGDTRLVDLDSGALRSLGWQPGRSAEEAVADAAQGIESRYRRSRAPLLTSLERRRRGSGASLAVVAGAT